MPTSGRTLHRLLGYRPWNDTFAHGVDAPLVEDVVIVDEASMVDVLMMDALFAFAAPEDPAHPARRSRRAGER